MLVGCSVCFVILPGLFCVVVCLLVCLFVWVSLVFDDLLV